MNEYRYFTPTFVASKSSEDTALLEKILQEVEEKIPLKIHGEMDITLGQPHEKLPLSVERRHNLVLLSLNDFKTHFLSFDPFVDTDRISIFDGCYNLAYRIYPFKIGNQPCALRGECLGQD